MPNEYTIAILGCGWLGLPLGAELAKAGYRVKGSTRNEEKMATLSSSGIRPFRISVEEGVRGEAVADFFAADLLVITLPPGRGGADVEARYPRQLQNIMAAAEGVPRILFTSSTGIYGRAAGRVTEQTPPDLSTSRGRALAGAEAAVSGKAGERATILRLAGLVGGDRHPARWLAGRKDLPGGEDPVNLVRRADVLGVILALIRRDQWGAVYNVVADEHPTRRVFYTHAAAQRSLDPPSFLPADGGDGKMVVNDKLKHELGYTLLFPEPMLWGP